ncbi:MAG: UDP-N-acetylmuramate--alanine ligase [Thermoleophilaceae bacterium]|jgi:UDP-N-acetylmuramate--alanine ligase|nr:UDP-N-acetylmuramate--alanine ligase [Thermoleophilaceae bacterium]
MDDAPYAGRSLHFVGIGGAGMSGLALVAHALGARVTGSDRADSPALARLREAGIDPSVGHNAAHLPGGAEVVVSTAIPDANPELAAARAAGATVLHRGDLLGELTRMKRTIAVSGAHGKTTTASMAAHVLRAAGRDPAFLIGGDLRSAGTNAAWGEGEWAVVEADESDRSFLKLGRDVAVVTNVELDHHSTYGSLADLEAAFAEFAAPAGLRVLGPGVELAGAGDAVSFDIGTGEGLRAERVELLPGGARFEAGGTAFELRVPGRHNVLNALAALAACRAAGVELAEAAAALATFDGAGRRFEEHARTAGGALVYDDYAHHPTEVRATLEAARTLAESDGRRLVACFQPHLYSRTQMLARDFGRALALADLAVVVDVYPARERAEDFPSVSGLLVAQAAADAARGRPVWWLPDLGEAERMLAAELGERDLLVTLGAGDVDRLARALAGEAAQ